MFESESWEIIDHYMTMIQQLNAQNQYISRTQNELYDKIIQLLRNTRSSPLPPLNRSRSSMTSSRNERDNVPPIVPNYNSFRRSYRENENDNGRRSSSQNNRSNTRSGSSNRRTAVRSNIPIRTSSSSSSSANTSSVSQNNPPAPSSSTNESENPQPRPPLFGNNLSSLFGSNHPLAPPPLVRQTNAPTNTSFIRGTTISPSTNFVQEFQWTPLGNGQNNQQAQIRPFSFFDNVPVYPTSEQVAAATRIVQFNTITNPNNTQCPITLVPFEPTDNVMQITHCGHIFDIIHLTGWFRNNVRCPVCRHDVRETPPGNDEPVGENNEYSLPVLTPDHLIEDTNDTTHTNDTTETDPEMPPLEPLEPMDVESGPSVENASTTTTTTTDPPTTQTNPTLGSQQLNIEAAILGLHNIGNNSMTTQPIWSFNQTFPHVPVSQPYPSSTNQNDSLSRAFSEMHTAMTTQGLDMISSAITQSIRDSLTTEQNPEPPSNDEDTRDGPP